MSKENKSLFEKGVKAGAVIAGAATVISCSDTINNNWEENNYFENPGISSADDASSKCVSIPFREHSQF
jgi:uncharacterized membrane protein YcjF (UPF0283 family)